MQIFSARVTNDNQRAVYPGEKSIHGMVYQSLTKQQVITFHMYGKEVGRRHDIAICSHIGRDKIIEGVLLIDVEIICVWRSWLRDLPLDACLPH